MSQTSYPGVPSKLRSNVLHVFIIFPCITLLAPFGSNTIDMGYQMSNRPLGAIRGSFR